MSLMIGNRLLGIAKKVPMGSNVADIGTDHALLPIYLVKENISPMAIATDAKIGPYRRALENVKREDLMHQIDLRLGEGLSPLLPAEVDVVIVAGMGGDLIANIVSSNSAVINSLDMIILQPMTRIKQLKFHLYNMGLNIVDEDVVQEGKYYYEIIAVRTDECAHMHFDCVDFIVGPILKHRRDKVVLKYLEKRCIKLEFIIDQIQRNCNKASFRALKDYKSELRIIREVLR